MCFCADAVFAVNAMNMKADTSMITDFFIKNILVQLSIENTVPIIEKLVIM